MDAGILAGDTAWILTSTALVTLMMPGLALYYGGMTGFKTTLNMLMMVMGGFCAVLVAWSLLGYTLAFGQSYGQVGLLGNISQFIGMRGMLADDPNGLPPMALVGFMGIFCGLTTCIIAGAAADRMKFGAWIAFAAAWSILVYAPVCHWVFAFDNPDTGYVGGWIANKLAAIDFAGGTAVHINSGAGALALAIVLGQRRTFNRPPRPNSLPLVLLGAGLLWVGWYGFNGGSALASGNNAAVASTNSLLATVAAALGWMGFEKLRDKHSTALGAASGMVTGLVAITPACGAVNGVGALIIGLVSGVICAVAVTWKRKLGYDDSLDVVGIHFVGGIVGTLMIGLLAVPEAPNGGTGLFFGGGFELLGKQAIAAGAVITYSFLVSLALAWVLKKTVGIRSSSEDEDRGLDISTHAERAYEIPVMVGD
ncbi:MAG: ammonium transporter [Bifidobacteriaceae bacterium]|jgi:Amt family ammonium transporter|nr:ammonium transporter [Bifidobacteriaceae bacterium]